ncbi:hypothetical protein FACS1894216_22070 [Synergistales bacterium]|nr:hypothetical protein FACS1894216_22070 [Synergistales bacterium]
MFGIKMDPNTGNAVTECGTYTKESDRGISDELWREMVADGKETKSRGENAAALIYSYFI